MQSESPIVCPILPVRQQAAQLSEATLRVLLGRLTDCYVLFARQQLERCSRKILIAGTTHLPNIDGDSEKLLCCGVQLEMS